MAVISWGKALKSGAPIGFVVLLMAAFFGLAWLSSSVLRVPQGILLPMLVIGGIVLLLAVLALMTVVFGVLGLDDRTQALGLPEGSIRAVIALSLVVLFATLSVFLYDGLSCTECGKSETVAGLSEADKDAFLKNNPRLLGVVVRSTPGTNGAAGPSYVISYAHEVSQSAQDLAKQLLTIIGTLMTAVAGFYFGAQSVASALGVPPPGSDTRSAPPTPRSLDPSSVPGPTPPAGGFNVHGDNLNGVKQAKLVDATGKVEIVADKVVSNDNLVTFTVPATANLSSGQWDVVLTADPAHPVNLKQALTVT